jgi:hypothetical protein
MHLVMELQVIQQRIYTIRNQRVMLDFDLAALYEVETKVFNQAVKRNLESFPADFMFQLTKEEWETNWSQIVTSSRKHRGKAYLPYAFTEHGVTMLASVLKSTKARQMNIAIVRAFIALRQVAITHYDIIGHLNELRDGLGEHDIQLASIYDTIENLLDKKVGEEAWKDRNRIGFRKENEKP